MVSFSQKRIWLHSIDFQQFENQNFEIFDEVLKNFGRSDVIKLKNNDFSLNAYLVSCPTCPKKSWMVSNGYHLTPEKSRHDFPSEQVTSCFCTLCCLFFSKCNWVTHVNYNSGKSCKNILKPSAESDMITVCARNIWPN